MNENTETTKEPLTSPNVRNYLDPNKFLADYYYWQKSVDRNFTYASWAQELKFNSRSFLRLLIIGKRNFTEPSLQRVAGGLKINKKDQQYFINLVRFSQSPTLEIKEQYAKKLSRALKGSNRTNIYDYYSFFSSHLGPRLQVLLGCNGVEKTLSGLAYCLNTNETKIKELLNMLESLGLAQQSEDGNKWRATSKSFQAKESLGNIALQAYHRNSLEEAIHAIDLPPQEREFLCSLFTLNEDEYIKLKKKLWDFLLEITNQFDSDNDRRKKLYQLNMNLIPVSRIINHSNQCDV